MSSRRVIVETGVGRHKPTLSERFAQLKSSRAQKATQTAAVQRIVQSQDRTAQRRQQLQNAKRKGMAAGSSSAPAQGQGKKRG